MTSSLYQVLVNQSLHDNIAVYRKLTKTGITEKEMREYTYATFNERGIPRRRRLDIDDYFFKNITWSSFNVALNARA